MGQYSTVASCRVNVKLVPHPPLVDFGATPMSLPTYNLEWNLEGLLEYI